MSFTKAFTLPYLKLINDFLAGVQSTAFPKKVQPTLTKWAKTLYLHSIWPVPGEQSLFEFPSASRASFAWCLRQARRFHRVGRKELPQIHYGEADPRIILYFILWSGGSEKDLHWPQNEGKLTCVRRMWRQVPVSLVPAETRPQLPVEASPHVALFGYGSWDCPVGKHDGERGKRPTIVDTPSLRGEGALGPAYPTL